MPVMSVRGCPYGCTFCSVHSVWERRITRRSIEGIMREVLSVKDQIREITFHDDTFVLNKQRVYAIIDAMKAEGIHLPWRCNGRVNTTDDEDLLKTMVDSGCRRMMIGLESGSDMVLQKIRKEFTAQQALEMLNHASKYFARLDLTFIWGYPFETMEDFYQTLEILGEAKRLPAEMYFHSHLLCAFPQTEMYREYKHLARFSRVFILPNELSCLPTGSPTFQN